MKEQEFVEKLKWIYNDRYLASSRKDAIYRLLDGIEQLIEDISGEQPVDKIGLYNIDKDIIQDDYEE